MFRGCTALASITIPNSVTSIGEDAFTSSGLTSITWPASIAAIPTGTDPFNVYGMFGNCTKLANVVLPEGLTTIGRGAFKDCTALASITLPSTIFSIEEDAFKGCTALTTVTIPASVKAIYFYGERYNSDKSGGLTTSSCPKLNLATQAALRRVGAGTKALAVPDGVTEIAEYAYRGYGELDTLIIPPSVTAIGEYAFVYPLRSITIGAGVNLDTYAIAEHFAAFYNNNGKKAGVYKYNRNTWSYTE